LGEIYPKKIAMCKASYYRKKGDCIEVYNSLNILTATVGPILTTVHEPVPVRDLEFINWIAANFDRLLENTIEE